jgi:hypothetical protein
METPSREIVEQEEATLIEGSATDEGDAPETEIESGVQIGPGQDQIKEEEANENVGLELGDLVKFTSTRADIETVIGLIYYIDESRISILEEGKSRKLVVFDMEQDEDGDYTFLEEYELTGAEIKRKRSAPSFVAQRDMEKDMKVETFTADGDALTTYTIQSVDEVTDSVVLVDDAGEVLNLSFEYKGIPRDRSIAPFDVLRALEATKAEATIPNEAPAGEVEEDLLDFEFLDDMEAPDAEEITGLIQATQKPAWLITRTDDEQINDMLRDRIRELDPAAQRSTKRIRMVTRLVWSMLSLRNDITRYEGSKPVGRRPVAYNTLVELLQKTQFPLAKQVLSVAKAIYVDHTFNEVGTSGVYVVGNDPESLSDPQIILQYLQDAVTRGVLYIDSQLKDGYLSADFGGSSMKKVPRWITVWQGFFNKYFQVISPIRQDGALKDIQFDQDFFRAEIPTPNDQSSLLSGFPTLGADSKTLISSASLKKIQYSYMRAIAARYGRYGQGGLTHKLEDADQAEVKGYLLFPLQYLRDLGYIRSGIILLDVANAMMSPSPMSQILQSAGDIVDIPEQGKIISVNFDGSTLGNIAIADWLKGQAIYGGGIGSLMPYLRSFGLLDAEFTVAQKLVLDTKVTIYRNAVKKMLKDFREIIQEQRKERKPIEPDSLLDKQRFHELMEPIYNKGSGEEILRDYIEDFKLRHPSYRKFDVAIFAYVYRQYPDLLINALAKNPQVARERLRVERDVFIQDVLDRLAGEKKLQDIGEPPQPNPCQHVKDLNKIRKIENNSERMISLNKFVRLYKLKKEDHWLWCNNGEPPHHLLCEHEYLLLEEFLRPKEKDTIHKEIILTFGGGKFNGQYICKQCGQPISDYEYDTHLEYSDDGVPMAGRAVLVDEDAIEEEKLQKVFTTEDEEEEQVRTRSEEEEKIYNVIAELAGMVGIFPDREAYEKMISRVKNALALVPDRGVYAQGQKQVKKAGKASTDYDIFISRILVSLCAASLLIDVQTHKPDYIIRYTLAGCANPAFTGFPRDPDASKPLVGMEYLACAISSVSRKGEPWELTGYQSISSSTERTKQIMFYLKTFTEQLSNTPDVQQSIIEKKQYLLETFGYETSIGKPKDMIPYGFTPAPFDTTKELGAEAEAPVVVETASEEEKVRAYIKQAHIYALKYGKYIPGSIYSEASCCYNNLIKPAEFWNSKDNLPQLPPHEPPKGSSGSLLYVAMTPRPLESISGRQNPSTMYKLFLRVCFKGPRLGQQHEPGYDNVCPWCEFKFPDDPRLPPPTRQYASDGKTQKKYDEEYESMIMKKQEDEIRALREAGVEAVTRERFEEVLTAVNQNGIIPAQPVPLIPTSIQNIRAMESILPPPFEDFEETIRETIVNLEALPSDASRTELLNAFAELSAKAGSFESELNRRLGDVTFKLYQELMKLPTQELGEALRTYFLIPFQRVLTTSQGAPRTFRPIIKASKTTDFSAEVMADLGEAYKRHTSYLNQIARDIPKSDVFIKAKMREVVNRLSIVIPVFIKVLRPSVVRGGATAATFLQRSIVAGIFAEFIMPNHIPIGSSGLTAPTSTITVPAKMPAKILQSCLLQYKNEGLNYSIEQIREVIQDRIEKEKAAIMKDKHDMTPEERKLDNMLQNLGMSKWAVGGTSAIRKYDPNQYMSEREAMTAAGITRFGQQMDVYESEGGYDHVQTREDDA